MLNVGPEENKSGEVMQNQERTVFTHVLVDPVCLLVFVFFSSSVFVCLFLTEEIRRNYAKPVVHGYSCGVYWPTLFTVCLDASSLFVCLSICLFLTEESRRNYAKLVVHGYSWDVYWPTVFTVSQRKVHNWF